MFKRVSNSIATSISKSISWTIVRGGGGGIPFPTDLTFDFNTRTDNLINDAVSGLDAEVVGGYVGVFDGSSFMDITEVTLNANEEWAITFLINPLTVEGYNAILGHKTNSTINQSLVMYDANKTFYIYSETDSSSNLITTADFIDNEINEVVFQCDGDGLVELYIGEVLQGSLTFSLSDAFVFNEIGCRKISSFCMTGELSGVNIDNKSIYYFNNLYDSIVDAPATNNGVAFELNNTDKLASTTSALNNGYYLEIATEIKVIDPQYPLPASGWVHILGGGVHNLIDSYVRFPAGIMDRSDATIFNDLCRSSIYRVVGDDTLWHISELNQYTFGTFLNVGYKGLYYNKFTNNSIDDRVSLDEFFGYATDKTFDDEIKVLKYTKDIVKALPDGSGSYITDSNGYVILME